jgi:DUF2938 family protein
MTLLLAGILMGLGATILIDLWALALNRATGLPQPNWAMVGRWAAHLPRGRVFHDAIGEVPPVGDELRIGWAFHYAVGIAYGVIFVLIVGADWLAAPTLLPAWIFAVLTIAAGWFLLHPGMGLGWAASKTPNPWKARGLGLVSHSIFGIGLWVVALVL